MECVIYLEADASGIDVYAPTRSCALDAPPKRFYRRSWTSVVRKLLECQRAPVFAMKTPITVDCRLRSNLGVYQPANEGS